MKLKFPYSPRILIIRYNLVPREFWLFLGPADQKPMPEDTQEDHSERMGVFARFI